MAKQQRRKPEPNTPVEFSAPQSAGDTTAATIDRDRVAQRAYELYLERGCQEGQDLDDWLCAERELTGGGRSEAGSRDEQERGQRTSGEQREGAAGAREPELEIARDER